MIVRVTTGPLIIHPTYFSSNEFFFLQNTCLEFSFIATNLDNLHKHDTKKNAHCATL